VNLGDKIAQLGTLLTEINTELGVQIFDLEREIDDRRDCFFRLADGLKSLVFGPTESCVRDITGECLVEEIIYYDEGSIVHHGDIVLVAVDTPDGEVIAIMSAAKEIK